MQRGAGEADDELDALLRDFEPLPSDLLPPGGSPALAPVRSGVARPRTRTRRARTSSATASAAEVSTPGTRYSDNGRRARYRARARNEVLYLREAVAELESELERWKRPDSDRRSLTTSAQTKVWQAIASRQRLGRRAAEAENAQLRLLLEGQLRFAAQLQRVMAVHRPPPRASVDAADVAIFEAYLSELDAAYAQTDSVMRETGLLSAPESPRRVIRVQDAGADGLPPLAEVLDTHVMLSDMATARGNTWEVVMREYMKRSGTVYSPESPQPGVLAIKYRYACKWLGRDAGVVITHTLKTYDEDDRQVAIYRVLSEGEGALAGIATDETGWSVMLPSNETANRCVCRVVTRFSPLRYHRVATERSAQAPPQLAEFTRLLYQTGDEDFGAMQDRLQRLSLDN